MNFIPLTAREMTPEFFNKIFYAVWNTYNDADNFEFLDIEGNYYKSEHPEKLDGMFPVINHLDWSKRGWGDWTWYYMGMGGGAVFVHNTILELYKKYVGIVDDCIEYGPDFEMARKAFDDTWEYIGDDKVRYVLGKPGNNNLLVIGVNPSTATPLQLDPTIKKVMPISADNNYDGWIMVNLYPQRSTNPKGMTYDSQLIGNNLNQIESVCKKYNIKDVWCAWGDLIDTFGKNSFLHKSWKNIETLLKKLNVNFYHYDTLTKNQNPRHPLYVPYGRGFHKYLTTVIQTSPVFLNDNPLKGKLYGAILGDILGAPYEFDKDVDGVKKTKNFIFFKGHRSKFTDDTVMTIAVADALLGVDKNADEKTVCDVIIKSMQKWGRKYPHAGYGHSFREWLKENNPQPYKSYGNGSAMRVSAVGWLFDSIERTREVARWTAEVTHNHPEGIKGTESVASAIFLARNGSTQAEIKNYIVENFGYDLNRTLDEIRPNYKFDTSCQGSVPEAIIAFLESTDFEDAIRNAVSLGGDADTLTCITGSIAEAFYGVPQNLIKEGRKRLPTDILNFLDKFNEPPKTIIQPDISFPDWRKINKKVAQDTLKITEQGFYKIDGKKINLVGKDLDKAIVISPEHSQEIGKKVPRTCVKTPPEIFIADVGTFFMCESNKKYLAMNFANANNPGGGFLNGANDQEEALCRQSTLYKSLSSSAAQEMYNYNHTHNKHCYSDYMIISPNVCVFRDIEGKLLNEPFQTSVITIPAPNLNGAAKDVPQEKIDEIMTARLKKMFDVAIHYGYTNLVLGAWGCGAFGHNPYRVAQYFHKLLFDEGYRYSFDFIIFAIYDKGKKKNFNAFSDVFWNVSEKLSEDYFYGEQYADSTSATAFRFSQNVFPHINFNFSPENFSNENIGYAHGILKTGHPFMAELWEYDGERTVAFYLPIMKNLFENKSMPQKSDKVASFQFDTPTKGFHALCVGMLQTNLIEDLDTLNNHVKFLTDCKLINFKTDMLNGYGFTLSDSFQNEIACITISLDVNGEESATTPLTWIPFNKPEVKQGLHVVKK